MWIDIEEYEERLSAREDRLMDEKPRITKIIKKSRKIIPELEKVAESIEEDKYFSMQRLAYSTTVCRQKLKNYIELWCEDNGKELFTFGGRKGSMIKAKGDY